MAPKARAEKIKTPQAVKNHPHINEGKGATLVPGTMHMHYNDLCIALSDYLCSMSITVRHRHAFSRSHACLCSCTIQCPALYVFTRVRACCHAPHSVLLCMISRACVLVVMHHTVSCSVCFHTRACSHAPHSVLLCMFSCAYLFSCTTQCPALYVFTRVLVFMHTTQCPALL